jgi:hypothetical protein
MPLSPHTEREHLHARALNFQGYRRADGLFDIEAHLTDVKSYGFPNEFRGQIEAGEAIHDMWLRVTLDDELIVRGIEAVTDAGPYQVCPAVTPNFKRVIGLRIGAGWRRSVRDKVGGVEGCTHLAETLVAMGTVAFQTLYPYLSKKRARAPGERPPLLNSCHAFSADGEVAKRLWPDYCDRPVGKTATGEGN